MAKSNTISTMESFVKQFAALVKGDEAEVVAQKTFRQRNSALNTQIAVMTGDLVAKEEAVTDAEEEFQKARLNYGKELKSQDRTSYVRTLVSKKNAIQEAQENLKQHTETLEFLKSELAKL
jgi:hypothetical protein